MIFHWTFSREVYKQQKSTKEIQIQAQKKKNKK